MTETLLMDPASVMIHTWDVSWFF